MYGINFGLAPAHENGKKVRFGFTSNNEVNCNSNDSVIGFGLGSTVDARFSSGAYCGYNCDPSDPNNVVSDGFPGFLWGR